MTFRKSAVLSDHRIPFIYNANIVLGNKNNAKQSQNQAVAKSRQNYCEHPPKHDWYVEQVLQIHVLSSINDGQTL